MIRGIIKPIRNWWNWYKYTMDTTNHVSREAYEKIMREDPYEMKNVTYPLNSQSLVVDLGAYTGDWAARIYCLYSCNIDLYEPHPELAKRAKLNFGDNPKIKVYPFGLSNQSGTMKLYGGGMSASLFKNNTGDVHDVPILKASEVFKERYTGTTIDLLKVNIEGAEYEVMMDLIKEFGLKNIRNIKISFHNNVKDYEHRRDEIQYHLVKTHRYVWGYDLLSESWELFK
jgi:FkbM family methyltransferase